MINKKTIFLIVVSITAIGLFSTFYFKYWHEPKATYIETNNPNLTKIRSDLDKLKADLRKKGLYSCCIRGDCNWCAIYMGHCPCADLVMEEGKEKSCPECAAAWNRKQGRFPSVDPDAIEVTTFGIYGFEKEGHHRHEEEQHH